MNIFKDESDVYGRYLPGMMHTATKKFFEVSRRIKQKLGNKSYKLDEYLCWILKIANSRLAADAAEDGRKYFSQLMSLCRGVLDYNLDVKEHEFYQTAKEFIVTHKFPYKENNTLLELYCALLRRSLLTLL